MRKASVSVLFILIICSQRVDGQRYPTDWAIGFQFTIEYSKFSGEPHYNFPNYLSRGFNYEISYKNNNLNGYFHLSWDEKTKKSISYHSIIPANSKSSFSSIGINYGYNILDNYHFRISPNAGMAFSELYIENKDLHFNNILKMRPALNLGVNFDIKLFGTRKNECYTDFDYTYIRARLSIYQTNIEEMCEITMINVEVSLWRFLGN